MVRNKSHTFFIIVNIVLRSLNIWYFVIESSTVKPGGYNKSSLPLIKREDYAILYG